MKKLRIDIETYSDRDLKTCGVYKYAESPAFTILLLAYAFDNDPVDCIDLATGEEIPKKVLEAIQDDSVIKTAFNASFERACLASYLKKTMPPKQWRCTMVKVAMLGLPLSLAKSSEVMGLELGKMTEGKNLIRYFCVPCKPTKVNAGRTRNLPFHNAEGWELFKKYNIRDVEAEREIDIKTDFFEMPAMEVALWNLDQAINDRGVLIDNEFIDKAIKIDTEYKDIIKREAIELTGLDNPKSVAQLKGWLEDAMDEDIKTLNKKSIPALIKNTDDETILRVLRLRQEMGKSSVTKYKAMENAMCADGRFRGMLQFYGALRTGRWAGRLVQLHNLPQNHLKDLDVAREMVSTGITNNVDLLFGNVPDTLSQLIRTAFIAGKGRMFRVPDFSAIEARVIAYLSGEAWRLEVFATHGKIYEASASQMFHVPIEAVTKTSDYRKKGKVSELALGYQGGPNALIQMGALEMGIPEDELPKIVKMWRNSNKKIVQYWYLVNDCAIKAVETGCKIQVGKGIYMKVENNIFWIDLPSGRRLAYQRPTLVSNKFGGQSVAYEGTNQKTGKWELIETYGGKIVENIVQAYARDLLANAMLNVAKAGHLIALHVHDEIVVDDPIDYSDLDSVIKIMSRPVSWAPGLPLKADGNDTPYYKKD